MPLTTYCPLDGILGDIVVGCSLRWRWWLWWCLWSRGYPTTGAA